MIAAVLGLLVVEVSCRIAVRFLEVGHVVKDVSYGRMKLEVGRLGFLTSGPRSLLSSSEQVKVGHGHGCRREVVPIRGPQRLRARGSAGGRPRCRRISSVRQAQGWWCKH